METAVVKKRTRKIPQSLIYDEIDGKPYYRKGYKSVLNKTQTLESIMGCSSLQTLLIEYFTEVFYGFSNRKLYHFFTGEPGLHLSLGNNLTGDICLYERSKISSASFDTKYFQLPPLIQIEIDVSIDLSDDSETAYIKRKTNKLLSHSVSKVIWVFTTSQSVLVATPTGPWQWMDWNNDVEILEGYSVNIGRFMASLNK
jgi:hypothetical protein